MSIEVENMTKRDLNDALECEVAYFAARSKAGLIVPGKLAWEASDYVNAVSEANQLALVARKNKKVVGVLVYARPAEFDGFDIIRLLAHPDYEEDYDVHRSLVGFMYLFCREDEKRNTLRLFVHGDDIDQMRFVATLGWKFKRLKDRDDTYVYSVLAE
jgi:ribosomal protein S18 acetylase RimI-like enzyme